MLELLVVSPSFWSATVLLLLLLPAVAGMLFGSPKGRSAEKVWAYRGSGVEVVLVLLPFAFYAVGNVLGGTYEKFMASAELPMAAMILFALPIFSVVKGQAAVGGRIAFEAFAIVVLVAVFLMMSCGAYISWLAYSDGVSPWFGVANSVLVVVAVILSFAVNAVMSYVSKYPEALGVQG